jgi:hypothetical protein
LITGGELNNTKDDSVLWMEKPVSEPFKWLRKSGTNGDQSNRDKHSEDKTIALRDVTGGFPFHAPMEEEKQDCKPSNDGLLKADSGCVEARHSSAWIGVTPDSGDGANELDDKRTRRVMSDLFDYMLWCRADGNTHEISIVTK